MKKVYIFLVASVSTMTSYSQQVSLDSILHVIEKRNPALANSSARAEALRAYARGSDGWMAPEVGGGLWMFPYKKVDDQRDRGQVMISVQQKFTNPSKLHAARAVSDSKAVVEEFNGKALINELRFHAREAYAQWVVYEKKKKVLDESGKLLHVITKTAQAKIPFNQSGIGKIYKAEARSQEIQNMQLMNDNLIRQQNIRLCQLMNIPAGTRFQIDTLFELTHYSITTVDTSYLSERRSDVKRMDKSIQSARLSQLAERTQARPDFNISFNHMIAQGAGMPNQFMLLGMVSIPIAPWASKGYKANIQGTQKEIESMQYERDLALNDGIARIASLRSDIETLERQLENYEKRIIPAMRRNYDAEMLAWEENNQELTDVLDALDALNMTRLQYLDTVLKCSQSVAELEKEMEE